MGRNRQKGRSFPASTPRGEKYHPIRENKWYERLKDAISRHNFILFVCGEDHRISFSKLLTTKGVRVDYTKLTDLFRM